MKITFAILAFFGAIAWSACTKLPHSLARYSPSEERLTPDELASLLDLHHWKITKTPDDGKPYWGVRIVVANRGAATVGDDPPYQMLYRSSYLQFETSIESKGNPNILLGLQRKREGITGQLIVQHPKGGSSSSGIEIPGGLFVNKTNAGVVAFCSGTMGKDNRVDLIEFHEGLDDHISRVVSLEFLHSQPKD